MRPSIPALAVLAALTACGGTTEAEFIEAYEPLFCQGYSLCATEEMLRTVNTRECLAYLRRDPYPRPPDCSFDRDAAELCLMELETSGCVDNDPEIPLACDEVYSGCPLPRVPPEDGFIPN